MDYRHCRRAVRVAVIAGAALLAAVLPLAMPTRVIPPQRPGQPVSVFLVDYGRTSALVVHLADRNFNIYVYGDWNYYALRRQGIADSVAALVWPTQGALGRSELEGPPTIDTIRESLGTLEQIYMLQVERDAATRLKATLDGLHKARFDTAVRSYGMTFVHHPKRYSYWSNSNHMTAAWLKMLGCDVRGPAFASRWHVTTSATDYLTTVG